MLGYRDSGMPDTEANARPGGFANADIDEAVGPPRGGASAASVRR